MMNTIGLFILLNLSIVSVFICGFSIHYAYDDAKNHAGIIRPAERPIHFIEKPSPEQVSSILSIFLLLFIYSTLRFS